MEPNDKDGLALPERMSNGNEYKEPEKEPGGASDTLNPQTAYSNVTNSSNETMVSITLAHYCGDHPTVSKPWSEINLMPGHATPDALEFTYYTDSKGGAPNDYWCVVFTDMAGNTHSSGWCLGNYSVNDENGIGQAIVMTGSDQTAVTNGFELEIKPPKNREFGPYNFNS